MVALTLFLFFIAFVLSVTISFILFIEQWGWRQHKKMYALVMISVSFVIMILTAPKVYDVKEVVVYHNEQEGFSYFVHDMGDSKNLKRFRTFEEEFGRSWRNEKVGIRDTYRKLGWFIFPIEQNEPIILEGDDE